jgi:release factor glutamine methyltransferase
MPDAGTWTVRRILEWTGQFLARKDVDSPRLSAELLLSHVLNVPRIRLFTDYERPLVERELGAYRDLVKRAGEHEPIAYLTGKAHFFNLELDITPGVLIPRPETETLVENVLQTARNDLTLAEPRVLDLCTGTGCIAAAIAKNLKGSTVTAIDVSEKAVQVATRNIERLGLASRVTVLHGDLYEPLTDSVESRPFNLILANPPYIPTAQIETLDRNVREFEPVTALDGGLDGLTIHRRILEQASHRLVPGGRVYLEIAYDQGDAARDLAAQFPELGDVKILRDLGGRDRVLTARKPLPNA